MVGGFPENSYDNFVARQSQKDTEEKQSQKEISEEC